MVPIQTGKLTRVQGEPKVGSVVSPHRQGVADTLSPQHLAHIMRQADAGDISAYLTLSQEIEERDPHYRSVLHTRKMAVSGIVPQVELPNDSAESKRIGEAVEKRIVHTPHWEGLVYDLLDALGKGFSCVETLWQRDPSEWWPREFRFREQRHFAFDRDTMTVPLLRTDRLDMDEEGVPLTPGGWVVHKPRLASGIPIRTGLARTIAVCYACKRWTAADWMAFLDVYGVPIRIGKYPASMADKRKDLLKAVRSIGSDAAAVIPQEMEVELIEAKGSGGSSVFRESIEYWDKQTSKCVLGQTMSTDDGASLAQSKTHEQVRFDIRDADARSVAATIDEQLIKPFVLLNFGPQEVYPRVRISARKTEDIMQLTQAVKTFVDLGGKVQASEVRDRIGLMEPEEGAELLAKAAPPVPPPEGGDTEPDGQSATPDPAGEDEEVEPDAKELNRVAKESEHYDATEETLAEEMRSWRRLEDENVGRLIKAIQSAESYEEARALLSELARDEGDVLDIGAVVVSLARSMYKLRGIGDATDERKP